MTMIPNNCAESDCPIVSFIGVVECRKCGERMESKYIDNGTEIIRSDVSVEQCTIELKKILFHQSTVPTGWTKKSR